RGPRSSRTPRPPPRPSEPPRTPTPAREQKEPERRAREGPPKEGEDKPDLEPARLRRAPNRARAPSVTEAEIEQDHKLIQQHIKLKTQASPRPLKDLQWKGPWRAEHRGKKGKLYRRRFLTPKLDAGRSDSGEAVEGWYNFLYDDAVAGSQLAPGKRDKVTI